MAPLLLHVFPSFAIGGQQTRFASIANRLGHAFRHRIISLDDGDSAIDLLDPTLDAFLVPNRSQSTNPFVLFRAIAGAINDIQPDVLLTYNWGAIEWAIANRIHLRRPHLHLEDGFGPDEADRQKWRRVLTRRLFLKHSTLIVPSQNLLRLASTCWGLHPERVIYIPNGIDVTRFDNISINGAPFFRRRGGECVIGSFSPLRREKNLERLLRIFASLSTPARLVICGEGPERASLVGLANKLNISDRVTFIGHVPRPELVMGAFDVFAITSDTEQMPYAVLEAMAARLPVCATAVGDIPIMVAEENRPFVIERDASDHLARALKQLCGDATLRRQIGEANRARAEDKFVLGPMTEAFRELLLPFTESRSQTASSNL